MAVVTQAERTRAPGVYLRRVVEPSTSREFQTGIPAFLGSVTPLSSSGVDKLDESAIPIRLWAQFGSRFAVAGTDLHLARAVHGFFENGGQFCYIVPLEKSSVEHFGNGLKSLECHHDVDLLCAPDLFAGCDIEKDWDDIMQMQQQVIDHCEQMGDRFAILDAPPGATQTMAKRQWADLDGTNAAIYCPWLCVGNARERTLIPPCGHVAGVFARTDIARGVHKAPANEVVRGVLDLERRVGQAEQADLNNRGVNCICSFPGRGIRVWGARTLNAQAAWKYVNVRRLFLTLVRWVQWNMWDVVFEPNNFDLWARIEREVNTYLLRVFRSGALKGATPEEAFYVRCDGTSNSPSGGETIVAEIGLAPSSPFEFVTVRLEIGPGGAAISGPDWPEQMSPNQGEADATNR